MTNFEITMDGPSLKEIFGPLSEEDDKKIRLCIVEINNRLKECASSVGERVHWKDSGLELEATRTRQVSISTSIPAYLDDGTTISFNSDLYTNEYYGQDHDQIVWKIESSVHIDDLRFPNSGLDRIEQEIIEAKSPFDAIQALKKSTDLLLARVLEADKERWRKS